VNLLRVRGAGVLSRHRHAGPVHGWVLKGSWRQGLTLAPFSAQPEPFLTHKHTLTPPSTPEHALNNLLAHPLSHRKRFRCSEK
jgi:hypothetical protein